MRTTTKLMIACLLATGCTTTEQGEYEAAARRVNPILLALKPTQGRLAAIKASTSGLERLSNAGLERVIDVCLDAHGLFRELSRVDFGARDETRGLYPISLAGEATSLSDSWWRVSCQSGEYLAYSRYVCAVICVRSWELLANQAEQLRYCAARRGVEIASLGGVRDPDAHCPTFSE